MKPVSATRSTNGDFGRAGPCAPGAAVKRATRIAMTKLRLLITLDLSHRPTQNNTESWPQTNTDEHRILATDQHRTTQNLGRRPTQTNPECWPQTNTDEHGVLAPDQHRRTQKSVLICVCLWRIEAVLDRWLELEALAILRGPPRPAQLGLDAPAQRVLGSWFPVDGERLRRGRGEA